MEKFITSIDINKQPLSELVHVGVKGMHWGHHKQIEESSNNHKGLTNKQKKNLKKAAIIVGSTTILVAGAYFTNQYINKYGTKTIKAGTDIQHVSKILKQDFSKPTYISYLKSDNKEYRNGYFKDIGAPYIKTLNSSKDIKIAGRRDVLKAFGEWSKNNKLQNSSGKVINNFSNKSEMKRAYRSFNYMMVSPDQRDQKVRDNFFSFLQNKGFSAIHDLHDQQPGTGIKSPLIMFGVGSNIMTKKIKEIDPSTLSKSAKSAYDMWKNIK